MTSAAVDAAEARLTILYESPDLLVVRKPAGLVCHPTKSDAWSSLAGRIRLYLGHELPVRLVHRLDRETSGVVIAAKTQESAGALGKALETRSVRKRYLAIVRGHPSDNAGTIVMPLGPDPLSVVAIKDCTRPDGVPATTSWRAIDRWIWNAMPFSLLEVQPASGRKHQIRIHLAALGHPIVGDKLYGGDEQIYLDFVEGRMSRAQWDRMILPCQALHAAEVAFDWEGRAYEFETGPEDWFADFARGRSPVPPGKSSSPFEECPLE